MEVLEYIFFTSLADAFMNDQTPETHTHIMSSSVFLTGLFTWVLKQNHVFSTEKKIIPTTAAARKKSKAVVTVTNYALP